MKETDDLGFANMPLCREPWESFYILRRGILPCCYGNPIIGAMPDYAEVWNSPELQDIRRHLSRELSPYCREKLRLSDRPARPAEGRGRGCARGPAPAADSPAHQ